MIQVAEEPYDLLIVGASVRAAAFSALRAGYHPVCLDRFADSDLCSVCSTTRIESFPEGIPEAVEAFPGLPILYTGPIDGHPEMVSLWEQDRRILGNGSATLERLADPHLVNEAVRQARLPVLEILSGETPPDPDGAWLRKPIRSGGGQGISIWDESLAAATQAHDGYYFQRRETGRSCSALFLASEGVGDVRFVGITEQLIGESDFGAPPFAWCGNVGPITLSIKAEHQVRRIGNFLKWKFELRGLFGIDFLVTDNDEIRLTDANPRYTGSVELLEFSTGQALLRDHISIFEGTETLKQESDWMPQSGSVLARGILFGARDSRFPNDVPADVGSYQRWGQLADIPSAGTTIRRGDPICSCYASGSTYQQAKENLWQKIAQRSEDV